MTAPQPLETYTGAKDDTTRVEVVWGMLHCTTEQEAPPTPDIELYRVVGFTEREEEPNTVHIHYVPPDRLNEILPKYGEAGEVIVEIHPTTWEEAEAEMAEYGADS